MIYKGLTLDKFQEEAIASIEKNHSVIVSAPTGSGKTLIADYIIDKNLRAGIKVIYTAPIKALSNQKYKEFSTDFGKENIGLLTGDVVINPTAPILIMTTEIYRNMVLTRDPFLKEIAYVILDEIHFINDRERGYVWEESIIFSETMVRFLCLSATIPNAEEFAGWISSIKGHPVDVIRHDKRPVPLNRFFFDADLGIATLEQIRDVKDIPDYNYLRGRQKRRAPFIKKVSHVDLIRSIKAKLPCFFFTFSREKCQEHCEELLRANLFSHNPQITGIIRQKFAELNPEINNFKSTRILRKTLPFGIGFHHAGLIPAMKELVEELFSKGLINVLYTTETFAVGIDMPAKTVCFDSLRKFDGINFRFLNSKEYFQIAGRAGRRGIDPVGFSYAMVDRRDFDYKLLKEMTTEDKEPIESQFRLSVNTVLNLIKMHSKPEIDKILAMNFYTYQRYKQSFNTLKKSVTHRSFNRIRRTLVRLSYVTPLDKLTIKGEFASRIYSDEITTGEMFATDFYKGLNEYQMLLLIGALAYEPRKNTEFKNMFQSNHLSELQKKIWENEPVSRDKRMKAIPKITALLHPAYHGKDIFAIKDNTNLLEGDLIRFYRQIMDRIRQIRNASDDEDLKAVLSNCLAIVTDVIKDVDGL